MRPTVVILIITTLIGFGSAGFFFTNNRTLIYGKVALEQRLSSIEQELASLKAEKIKADTELAVLKNTDLAKEVELLQLKLKTTEKDLAKTELDLASANKRLKTVEANRGKVTSHLDAIEAVSKNYWHYTLTEPILDGIEAKVKALSDSEIFSLWIEARKQTTPNSANPSAVWDVVGRILAKVRNLLP